MTRMLPDADPAFTSGSESMMGAPDSMQGGQTNALKLVHRLLRGRYALTVVLAAIGATGGAVGGYLATSPKYETIGMISIDPVQPKILDDRGAPMQNFSSFVNKQAAFMGSLRVLDAAMESPEWRDGGFGTDTDAKAELRRSLKIDTPRDSELIIVRCIAKDPKYTGAAVKGMIDAYEKMYANIAASTNDVTIEQLKNLIEKTKTDIESKNDSIRTAAVDAGKGTDDLSLVHAVLLERMSELESRLHELKLRLGEAGVANPDAAEVAPPDAPPGGEPTAAEPTASQPPPPFVIAATDEQMARLLSAENDLQRELATLRARGLLDNHQSVQNAANNLKGVQEAIRLRAESWWEARKGLPAAAAAPGAETVDELRRRYASLRSTRESLMNDLNAVAQDKAKLDALRDQRAQLVADRESIRKRLSILEAEAAAEPLIGGRIKVVSRGDTPGSPTVDKRKQLAAMGVVAGGGIPVALMLLLGLVDRRFRYSDQADELGPSSTLLGMLPVLPKELGDPEQRAVAAHCVHQVRLLLQIGGQATGRKVYAITSPTAGDGKTSLALSLGLSFSAAGARTLLIDFDMIGTGLTSSLRLLNGHTALSDAMGRGTLDSGDLPLASDKLWVLPSRGEDDHLVSRLSHESVNRLIEQARKDFDIVLVDTGPILGSLEASLVASGADGVIVVVGRGQRRDHIEQAFARIGAVGGRLIGMVFNRATPGDFKRSVSSTSLRSIPRALALPPGAQRPDADRLGDAGPVARTVAIQIDAESKPEKPRRQ